MSTVLKDSLSMRITKSLKENNNTVLLERTIRRYIDVNSEVLYASGPIYRLYMTDEDREILFKVTKVNDTEINELIKKIDDIDANWTISTPFNILSTLTIRSLEMSKNQKVLNNCIMYLVFSLYPSLHFKYYRKFLPNKAAMDYTINNMTNKFLIKKYATMYKALEHLAMKCHETYRNDLIRGTDLDIKNYIMNLKTRINNFLQVMTNEYIKVFESKKYLNTETESRDEENYLETSNVSLQIEKLLSMCFNKFASNSINPKFVRIASNVSNTHAPTLDMSLKSMKDSDDRRVNDLMRYIVKIYFNNKLNSFDSIKTKKFIPYQLQIYGKSNIKDDDVINMKKLLDSFLNQYSSRYNSTEREATKINYRKGLYVYFLLHIQSCAMTIH